MSNDSSKKGESVLILALGDIYWTRFALHLSNKLNDEGVNVVVVLESRVGEYQAYFKRCEYPNAKSYYLSDYFNSYKYENTLGSDVRRVMCDYLRVAMHGHKSKLLETDWNLVSSCISDFSAHVLESEDVGLIISDQVSTSLSYTFCEEALSRKVDFWGLSGSRLPGRYVIAHTIASESEIVKKKYEEIISGKNGITEDERGWAEDYIEKLDNQVPDYMRSARLNKLSLGKFFNKIYLKIIVGTLLYSLYEVKDKNAILIKTTPIVTILSSFAKNIKRWFKAKYIQKYFIDDIKSTLAGKNYYIYPIHYQPEASTVVGCPFYTDQLNVITNLAFSLPMGAVLVVKEHVSNVGFPSNDFYQKVSSLPNVVLVWHEENIKQLIRGSNGVITLTSTAGFEALLLDKPVYHFGDVFYTFHPNAVRLADWNKCREQLLSHNTCSAYDNIAFLVAYRRCTYEGKIDFVKNDFGIAESILEKIRLKWV
ncbi:MAG: hypothetical protein ACI9N9_001552 [Enterobacterales bacterium]